MTITIRAAHPADAQALSELALASKAIWGYDADFLARARFDLVIDCAMIADRERYRVGVAVDADAGTVAGFYAVRRDGATCELERLFVAPGCVRAGVGRRLWTAARCDAAAWGYDRVRVASDPNAAGFYERCGGVLVGTVASPVDATRRLPLLELPV